MLGARRMCVIGSLTEPGNPRRSVHVNKFRHTKISHYQSAVFASLHLADTKGVQQAMQHVPRTNALSESESGAPLHME